MKHSLLFTFLFILVLSPFLSQAQQWQFKNSNTIIHNTNAGNVGIGMIDPKAKLDILETTPLSSSAGSFQLLTRVSGISTSNTFMQNTWLYRGAAGSNWLTATLHDAISIDGSFLTPHVDTKTWWERDPYNNIQAWGTGSSVYMAINNGNVGIGTNAPGSILHVHSQDSRSARFTRAGYRDLWGFEIAAGTFGLYDYTNAKYIWRQSASDLLLMESSGNVGIGTSDTKGYKLGVNGSVIATSMTVKLYGNWPDFVFAKTHRLRPLSEVESYIQANQHLPEVPSAAEVAKDGINLGEMDATLLKKIEELTLYMIEQNNRLNILEKENVILKNEVKTFKK